MTIARLMIAALGSLLPYLARLPGGGAWVAQYSDLSLAGMLFFGAFNAIAWGAIIGIGLKYRHVISLLFPAVPGFCFLGWAHGTLDLNADAQSGIALIFIPIYALLPIVVGGVVGGWLDRWLTRRDAARAGAEIGAGNRCE